MIVNSKVEKFHVLIALEDGHARSASQVTHGLNEELRFNSHVNSVRKNLQRCYEQGIVRREKMGSCYRYSITPKGRERLKWTRKRKESKLKAHSSCAPASKNTQNEALLNETLMLKWHFLSAKPKQAPVWLPTSSQGEAICIYLEYKKVDEKLKEYMELYETEKRKRVETEEHVKTLRRSVSDSYWSGFWKGFESGRKYGKQDAIQEQLNAKVKELLSSLSKGSRNSNSPLEINLSDWFNRDWHNWLSAAKT